MQPVIEISELEMHELMESENFDEVFPPSFDGIPSVGLQSESSAEDHAKKFCLKWSGNYKMVCKIIYDKHLKAEDFQKAEQLLLSESESVLAMFELGKLYASEKWGKKDTEKSFAFYQRAL